ncbi:COX15/CtaA family protein [soil metagenome]
MRSFRLSPEAYRRITVFALAALAFIIVTGGAVRLTGSGLGCTDWPTCEDNRIVAPLELHPMIEFVNRAITGLVSIAVILAVLGSLLRAPRRRDLTWWSVGLVAGVLGQIVLGGVTVLFHLWPPLVMAHFILSMVLVCNAVVLHHRASTGPGRARPIVGNEVRALSRALVVAAVVVILSGTIVTGAGPHGGDEDVDRLPLAVGAVARAHGLAVTAFLALTLATLWVLHRRGAPESVAARGRALLFVLVLQGAIGYTQYFTEVPPLLVGLHIFGSVLVWAFTLRFHLHLSERQPLEARPQVAAERSEQVTSGLVRA